MRIALIAVDVHKHGGVPLCVAHLAEELSREHEVTVIGSQLKDVDRRRVRFYRVPLPRKGPHLLEPLLFFLGSTLLLFVLRALGRARFDIIHAHGEEGRLLANVQTSHFCQREEWEALRSGRIILPQARLGQKLRAFGARAYRRFMLWLEERWFAKAHRSLRIVVSPRMAEDFRRHYGPACEDLAIIPHGVDSHEFHPALKESVGWKVRQEHGLSQEDFVLLFLGGDWERKGLRYALQCLTLIPEEPVKLVVVGRGDAGFYRRLARRWGVERRAVFVPPTLRQAHYYAASDALLFPTLYEPFGLVVLEAMASGLPVVVSRIAGAADYITDGQEGFLLEDPRDAQEMAQRVRSLLADPVERQRMGMAARRTAEQHSWRQVALATLREYERFLTTR